jgi:hypothetical protein
LGENELPRGKPRGIKTAGCRYSNRSFSPFIHFDTVLVFVLCPTPSLVSPPKEGETTRFHPRSKLRGIQREDSINKSKSKLFSCLENNPIRMKPSQRTKLL